MEIGEIYAKYDVSHWQKYRPLEPQYAKFLPHEILAGFKIEDVYYQLCNARASLAFMEVEDYGQLIGATDDLHLKYVRSKFLFDALANYNYCIDLSWQVLYLYYGQDDYGMIQDGKRYEDATKECDLEALKCRMVGLTGKATDYDHVLSFFNAPLTAEIRTAYNYIKPRGTFYIEGMGMNDDKVPIGLDGSTLRMINRKQIDLEQWKAKLVDFDVAFCNHFNTLIKTIMPPNFTDTSLTLDDLVSLTFRLKDWEKKGH